MNYDEKQMATVVVPYSFATRMKLFLDDIQVNDPFSDEELVFLKYVSSLILEQQFTNTTDKYQIDYLKRNHETSNFR